jgi:exonuclease III
MHARQGYSGTAVLIRGEHGALAKPIPPKLSKGKGSKSSTPSAKTNQSSIMDAFKKSSSGAAPAPSTVTPVKDSTMDVTDEGVIQSAPLVVKAVEYGIGKSEHDQEGRSITVELADMFVVGLYVPNSGDDKT